MLSNLSIQTLTKQVATANIDDLVRIVKQHPLQYWEQPHFLVDLPEKWFFSQVAFVDDEVVGYIIASQKTADSVHIHKYMVDEKYTGHRIGKYMLSGLNAKCYQRDIETVTLRIYEDNVRGIRFHSRNGFQVVSQRDTASGVNIMMAATTETIEKCLSSSLAGCAQRK